ncbi:hypothetical protein KCP76_24645 [Salmonella enterica subsp. enterica serovar Weltevreden]|nr:hypothetical protein KCP76_24645 [Salmonella enterica subsp. enterica serovar Weltevreden]
MASENPDDAGRPQHGCGAGASTLSCSGGRGIPVTCRVITVYDDSKTSRNPEY